MGGGCGLHCRLAAEQFNRSAHVVVRRDTGTAPNTPNTPAPGPLKSSSWSAWTHVQHASALDKPEAVVFTGGVSVVNRYWISGGRCGCTGACARCCGCGAAWPRRAAPRRLQLQLAATGPGADACHATAAAAAASRRAGRAPVARLHTWLCPCDWRISRSAHISGHALARGTGLDSDQVHRGTGHWEQSVVNLHHAQGAVSVLGQMPGSVHLARGWVLLSLETQRPLMCQPTPQ